MGLAATPLASARAPMAFPSSENATVPVSVGPAVDGAAAATEAWRSAGWPKVGAAGEAVSVVFVQALLTTTVVLLPSRACRRPPSRWR